MRKWEESEEEVENEERNYWFVQYPLEGHKTMEHYSLPRNCCHYLGPSQLTIALNFDAHGTIGDFEGSLRDLSEFFDFAFCSADNVFTVVRLKKPEALMHEGRRSRLGKLKVGEHHGDHHRWVS